jgi:hypothetical protein
MFIRGCSVAPAGGPAPVLPPRLVPTLPRRHRRSLGHGPVRAPDQPGQAVLDVDAQLLVLDQLRDPGGNGRAARHVTAPTTPGSPACSCASRCSVEAPARSSTVHDRSAERSPEHQPLAPATARSPPAPRTTDSGPKPSAEDQDSRRQRGETIACPPLAKRRCRRPRPPIGPLERSQPNQIRSSRQATVGRPGDGICPRYSRSLRCRGPTHIAAPPDRGVAMAS